MVKIKCRQNQICKYRYSLSDFASRLSLEYDITVSVLAFDTEAYEKYKNDMPSFIELGDYKLNG